MVHTHWQLPVSLLICEQVKKLLKKVEFVIVPVVNPDGYVVSVMTPVLLSGGEWMCPDVCDACACMLR